MTNVKSATLCLKCKVEGIIKGKKEIFEQIECPACKMKWQTITVSKIGGMKI